MINAREVCIHGSTKEDDEQIQDTQQKGKLEAILAGFERVPSVPRAEAEP